MAQDPTLITSAGSFTGDPAAYTLEDYARFADAPETQATIKTMYENRNVLTDIPFVTDEGAMEQKVKRFTGASLPRVDFMPANKDPYAAKFAPEDYVEKAYIIRQFVDVDTIYVRAKNQKQNIQQLTPSMYMYALGIKMNDYFINNNHATGDVLAPVGLRARLADTTLGIPADMVINAAVNIAPDNTTTLAQQALALTNAIDTLLSNMGNDTGQGSVGYTNSYAKNAVNMALKAVNAGGGYSTNKDNYDRVLDYYRELKMVNLGRKVDQSLPVVGFEDSSGNLSPSGKYTSIFVVRYGQEYFHGWHWGAPSWKRVGVIDNQITDRMFFEYILGFMDPSPRAIGRIYGIKVLPG